MVGYSEARVLFRNWIKATHLCSCYRHQSMWKWVVNTSLFTQHSFIFLWDAKGCTYTKRHQMRRDRRLWTFKMICPVPLTLFGNVTVLPHTHTRNIRTGNNNNNPNLSLPCTVERSWYKKEYGPYIWFSSLKANNMNNYLNGDRAQWDILEHACSI